MTGPVLLPKKTFCLCGYPVVGTEQERLALLEAHWKTRMHRRRLKEQGK